MEHSLWGGGTPLQRCGQCILQPQQTGQFYMYVLYLANPSTRTECDFSILRTLSGLNSEFFFSRNGCHINVKGPNLPHNLHIDKERKITFIPVPKILALYEMQTASSSIWTQVAVSISNDDEITQWTLIYIYIYIYHKSEYTPHVSADI